MSWDFYNYKTRKAKKDHKCDLCRVIIPKGAEYITISGKCFGDLVYFKEHIECNKESERQNEYNLYDEPCEWFADEKDGDPNEWREKIKGIYHARTL